MCFLQCSSSCIRVNQALRMSLIYYHSPDGAIKEYQANSMYLKMSGSHTLPQETFIFFFFFPTLVLFLKLLPRNILKSKIKKFFALKATVKQKFCSYVKQKINK